MPANKADVTIIWTADVGDKKVRYEAEVVHERTVSVLAYGYEQNRRHWFLFRRDPSQPWYIDSDADHPAAAGIVDKVSEHNDEVTRLAAVVIRHNAKEEFARRSQIGEKSLTRAHEKASREHADFRAKWGITTEPAEYVPFATSWSVISTAIGPVYAQINDHSVVQMHTTPGLPLPPSGLARDPFEVTWKGDWVPDLDRFPPEVAEAFQHVLSHLQTTQQDAINKAVAACDARFAHDIENARIALGLWRETVSEELDAAERKAEALLATLDGPAATPTP